MYRAMFQTAFALARKFTLPVVVSVRTVGGKCSAGIGTFVVLNEEGWIITAAHVWRQFEKLAEDVGKVQAHQTAAAAIQADASLSQGARRAKLRELGRLSDKAPDRVSAWWGSAGEALVDVAYQEEVDLCVGRLTQFKPDVIEEYPKLKQPMAEYPPGASLCKLGFPFFEIKPSFDEAAGVFRFPDGALPMPLFPMDGIITRTVNLEFEGGGPPYPVGWIETSTPGLRGQSGGPTFDTQGAVWAIQVHTSHLPLGFEIKAKPPAPPVPEQFLHVGRGVHVGTICGILDSLGVKYYKAPH